MFRLPVTFVGVLIHVGAGGCAQRTYRRESRRPRHVAGGDRRPGRVSPSRAGPPPLATGVNRRRDPRSQL